MEINLRDLTKAIIKEQADNKAKSEVAFNNEIAIIGLSCRIAAADDKDEYWNMLKNGWDCIRKFPANREKVNEVFLKVSGKNYKNDGYYQGGFLGEIDKFDYELFDLSPLEASLMSPNQRIFLEAAWAAIEDAGYGGKKITGSNTGVFLGHSTDFGIAYKEFIEVLNPEMAGLAISGNLNSLIASRISYLLDLRGPSLLVDTACSSSLAAIHTACLSLRNRECDMALAGAVKIDLLPLSSIKSKEDEIGITSPDSIARVFDDKSEGTGLGEGVGAVLLKPLSKALEDGDHIYAIIKGSAVNQDGSSVNLTSPNPASQEKVIIKAWQDAGINPETVTYIEAHGTGTKLGDPIEVKGIEKAFKRHTNKKQFCAIGSVKSNIGHLDNAAGMAGLIKAVFALKYKMIPPSIHFKSPNKKIDFEDTSVYVNDILREWRSDKTPRRCGISAFGLSGTNCHVVLEEAPEVKNCNKIIKNKSYILALSAKSREGILELIWGYFLFLYKEKNIDLNSVCYTANTGRGHYNCRLAIIFHNIEELLVKLEKCAVLESSELLCHDIFYGEFKIVSERQKKREVGEITQSQKRDYTEQANKKLNELVNESKDKRKDLLYELCKLYINGSDIEWELLHKGDENRKVSLPVYPFSRKKCWVNVSSEFIIKKNHLNNKETNHPLFERCLADSFDQIIYQSVFVSSEYWILNEHKVAGAFVVPGTAYLEMITEILVRHYPGFIYRFNDVVFINPISLNYGVAVEVHSVIKNEYDGIKFKIASRLVGENKWMIHVEGRIDLLVNKHESSLDIDNIKKTHYEGRLKYYEYKQGKGIETGPRWDCIKKTYIGNEGVLVYLCLNEKYLEEINQYNLHPALLDEAVNVALRSVGEDLYLPFSYKNMVISDRLPGKVYSYIKRNDTGKENEEFASFNITITDDIGTKIVQIEDYTIKRVNENRIIFNNSVSDTYYSKIKWMRKPENQKRIVKNQQNALVFKGEGNISNSIIKTLKEFSGKVVEVKLGTEFNVFSEDEFSVFPNESGYTKVFEHINISEFDIIIYMHTLKNAIKISTEEELKEVQEKGIYGLFYLTKALVKSGLKRNVGMVIIAQYANEVNWQQEYIIPENAALIGLGKALGLEYPKIKCRSIDIDDYTQSDTIVTELKSENRDCLTAFRYNQRFVPYLDSLDINDTEENKLSIKENGIYVITGGLGSIGLKIAKFLSSKAKVNIALINRSVFPSAEEWGLIEEKGEDSKLCNKIAILKAIKQNGSNIIFYSSDVSRMDKMKEVINDIKTKYGQINGVFHLAGNAGDGFIVNKDISKFKNVTAPKMDGTWIINKLIQAEEIDFFVMFSSITSIVPEAGQADYVAANSYLDAYSAYGKRQGIRCITINWPSFTDTGMAVDYGVDFDKEIFSPISSKKALNVLDTILERDIQNVIVGEINNNYLNSKSFTLDLSIRLITYLSGRNKLYPQTIYHSHEADSDVFNVVITGSKDDDSYTETERKIANIIGNALGLRQVNIHDGFLELGGNSIIAVKIEMDMEKNGIPITISELYEYKSIKELAEFLERKNGKAGIISGRSEPYIEKMFTKTEIEEFANKKNVDASSFFLIDNIRPFNEIFYKTCFHNSLFPILNHFGRNPASMLANDIFIYNTVNDRDYNINGMRNIFSKTLLELLNDSGIEVKAQNHACTKIRDIIPDNNDINILKQISNYIGIMTETSKKSTANLLSDIKNAITNRRPVIIWVDCFYESIRQDTYKKEHWMHTLLLYGFDDNRKVFFAVEHKFKENLTYTQCEISFKDVANSYEGFLANYKDYTEMPSFYEFYANYSYDADTDMREYKNIYKESLRKNKSELLAGIRNMVLMADKVSVTLKKEQQLKKDIDGLISMLNSIINAKQVEKYIISTLFIDEEFDNNIKKVIDSWIYIRQVLVKYKYSSIYDAKKIMSASKRLREIYLAEQKYYTTIFFKLLQ
jgi:polyketide synthase PksN